VILVAFPRGTEALFPRYKAFVDEIRVSSNWKEFDIEDSRYVATITTASGVLKVDATFKVSPP
jgi:hypothetical protein